MSGIRLFELERPALLCKLSLSEAERKLQIPRGYRDYVDLLPPRRKPEPCKQRRKLQLPIDKKKGQVTNAEVWAQKNASEDALIFQNIDTIGAGRGGRTPTRLPSADFESDFRHFAGYCIATQ